MNIGIDNDMNEFWGAVIDVVSNSGLVSSERLKRHSMWTTRLCRSNFALEDIALNDFKELRRFKN